MLARAADFRAAELRSPRSAIATSSQTCPGASSRRPRWTSSRARSPRSSCAATSRWPASASSPRPSATRSPRRPTSSCAARTSTPCVVYGVVGDKYIEGSLRTHSPSVDPAVWLEQAFGHDDKGRAYGGGRRDKGGFRIPIGFLGRVDRSRAALAARRARDAQRAPAAARRRAGRGPDAAAARRSEGQLRSGGAAAGCASRSSACPLAACLLHARRARDRRTRGSAVPTPSATRRLRRVLARALRADEAGRDRARRTIELVRVARARPDRELVLDDASFRRSSCRSRRTGRSACIRRCCRATADPDPYFWAIDSGDEITGVTAHRIADEYDTGAILAQRDACQSTRMERLAARARARPPVARAAPRGGRDAIGELPHDGRKTTPRATLAPLTVRRRARDRLEVDERADRATSPRGEPLLPGAWTLLRRRAGDHHACRFRRRRFPRALVPGEAAVVGGVRPSSATGDGALALLEGRIDAADDAPRRAARSTPAFWTRRDLAALIEIHCQTRPIA